MALIVNVNWDTAFRAKIYILNALPHCVFEKRWLLIELEQFCTVDTVK